MSTHGSVAKPYKGLGMEGPIARWYASLTGKGLQEFKSLASRIATRLRRGSSVLEVAPGPGYFAVELRKMGDYRVTGLDISETFVEIARANAARAGVAVNFRHGNASNMPFDNDAFDFLFCRAAFKNFAEPLRALEEMHRVLKPGGTALIIDLRRDASKESISQGIDAMELGAVNSIITKLTFRFMLLKRAYTRLEFEQFLAQTKFQEIEIQESPIGLELWLTK
ncbi:MAG: class I SAM-dependent methyltransferase [Acidobacteriaceae bacterium]|nr:class I SAM-dependent methyltransferase [Acidobacteriaceae bacterium]